MTSAGDKRRSPLAEALTAFAVATALTALLYQVGRFVPFIADNLQAFVAVVFIYLPVWIARRRGEDLSAYGFTTAPLRRSLAFGVGGPLLVFPLFLVGFVLYYGFACAIPALAQLTPPGMCPRFLGWSGLAHPHVAPGFLMQAFSQVVVVGQGYVGLPLAMRAVEVGHSVVGFDDSDEVATRLTAGASHVEDVPASQVKASSLAPTSSAPATAHA